MLKLTKRQINQNIVPHLSKGSRGPSFKVAVPRRDEWRIVRAILYRMRTGTQWRHLPMKSLLGRHLTSWQSGYNYFSKMIATVKRAGIATEGLFLNGDAGFDAQKMRDICARYDIIPNIARNKKNRMNANARSYFFDSQLYEECFAVERTNAWISGFKALLIRYETNAKHWLGWDYIIWPSLSCCCGEKVFGQINFRQLHRFGLCTSVKKPCFFFG